MKIPFLFPIFLFFLTTGNAQVLGFDHGKIEFYTSTAITDIEASTNTATVSLNLQSGDIEVKIPIKSFDFEYDLMKEHFEEKYMESEKYPEAKFIGKIQQDIKSIGNPLAITANGIITIHGVNKEISIKAQIFKESIFTVIKSKIPILFADFNVDEPSILSKSIAKEVEINSVIYLK